MIESAPVESDGALPTRSSDWDLCAAVIQQAVSDLFAKRPDPQIVRGHMPTTRDIVKAVSKWQRERDAARAWIFADPRSTAFSTYCDWLGYDDDVFRAAIAARMRREGVS